MPIRVAIVDDQQIFLDAARERLEQDGLTVVATGRSGLDAEAICAHAVVDVLLLDLRLGDEDGIEVAAGIASAGGPPVVLMSGFPRDEVEDLVHESATIGFIEKSELSGAALERIVAAAD